MGYYRTYRQPVPDWEAENRARLIELAHEAGVAAGQDIDVPSFRNPHRRGTEQHRAWEDGWVRGRDMRRQ